MLFSLIMKTAIWDRQVLTTQASKPLLLQPDSLKEHLFLYMVLNTESYTNQMVTCIVIKRSITFIGKRQE